jgi:uncharacterized membrane protein YbhN (UPF0104 family)
MDDQGGQHSPTAPPADAPPAALGIRRHRLVREAARLVVVMAVGVGIVAASRHTSLRDLAAALGGTDLTLLGVAAPVLLALNSLLRAARFHVLLADACGRRAPFCQVFASVLVSQAANNVLPLRAGDLVRTRDFLARGHTLARVASAQFAEKSVELASLLVLTSPLASCVPLRYRSGAAAALVVAAVAAPAAWLFWRVRGPGGWVTRVSRAGRGIADLLRALLWSIAADGTEFALIHVCLVSLHIDAGWIASAAVLAGVNLAIALPAAPGNVGTFEAGATFGLVLVGVPVDQAVPFAVLYRIVQWGPPTFAGGLVAWLRRRHDRGAPPPQSVGSEGCNAVA